MPKNTQPFSLMSPTRASLPMGDPRRDQMVVDMLIGRWEWMETNLDQWNNTLEDVKSERVWERYPPGKPYGSLDAMLKAEIGFTAAESIGTIQERTRATSQLAKPAMKHGALPGNQNATKSKGENEDYNYNVRLKHQGTSAEYLTSVIARDHPEIHNGMKAGKYRSVRQAAIEAGLVKPAQFWTAPVDIEKLTMAIRKRFTPEEQRELALEILGGQQ